MNQSFQTVQDSNKYNSTNRSMSVMFSFDAKVKYLTIIQWYMCFMVEDINISEI